MKEGEPGYETLTSTLKKMVGDDFPFREAIVVAIEKQETIVAPRYRFFPDTTEENQILDSWKSYRVDKYGKRISEF